MATPPVSSALRALVEPPIGWLVVDRPETRGALTAAMWLELPRLLSELAAEPDVRIIVIRGADGHFIAGADIGEFGRLRADPRLAREYDRGAEETLDVLADLPLPSLAMIDGACIGGGCLIAFGCDLRIVSDKARVAIPAGRIGLAYPYKGIERLAALLGEALAVEMLLTGRVFEGHEAERAGLAHSCVAATELESATRRLAAEVASSAPLALRYARLAVRRSLPSRLTAARIAELADECFQSRDYAEGIAAFLEKRPPKFKGA